MAKPLLTNHTSHHHSPLITLTKEENAQCNLLHHSHEPPPKLLFTPATTALQTSTKRATAITGQDSNNIRRQTILSVFPSSATRNTLVSAHSGLSLSSAHQASKNTPILVNTTQPHNHPVRRSSTDVTASGRRTKLSRHSSSSSSVINRSAAAASGGGSGGETGNVTARLLDMGKRLLDAAREGQTDHVRQLVVGSGAPFTSDWLGTTALHLAAQYGHAEIADILLRGGVNRDARTKLERTALHLAAQSGSLQVLESLLIHGSDINARDMLKMTPLHWAVERRHIEIVKRLLVGGADINVKSKFQLAPLDIAQNSGYYEIVELFKNWTDKDDCDLRVYDDNNHHHHHQVNTNNTNNKFYESHDIFNDVNYQLLMAENTGTASQGTSMLDIDEPCIDLVELEWNSLKFEADFSHPSSHNNDNNNEATREQKPCELECLMKMVEELQKENEQLRRRLEQLPDETK